MNRAAMLGRLAAERFDVLVVGGGATGLGCAVDAAARGYRTALVEAADFSAATSSRSTKLVHGGVRYLAQGDVHLVREALLERSRLLRNAPCTVHKRTFLAPAYRWYEAPYFYAGLRLYDALAARGGGFAPSRLLSPREALERLPWLQERGLRGAIAYEDGQFDDARLAIALARTAASRGAAVANYARVTALRHDAGGKIAGAAVRDAETGDCFDVRARAVVNAAGIFVDELRRMDDAAAPPMLSLSRGTHLAVDPRALPGDDALLVPKTGDRRVLFVIPWHERVLVGTTDIPARGALLHPQATSQEIEYLLATVSRYAAVPLDASAVTATFAGLRPLVERRAVSSTAKLSREHVVDTSPSGLVTIAGGKWTTYRKMAQDAIDEAAAGAELPHAPCATAALRLEDDPREELAALVREDPSLAQPLAAGFAWTRADVVHAARSEMARTADDVLARRTRLAFLDARAAAAARPAVEELLAAARR